MSKPENSPIRLQASPPTASSICAPQQHGSEQSMLATGPGEAYTLPGAGRTRATLSSIASSVLAAPHTMFAKPEASKLSSLSTECLSTA